MLYFLLWGGLKCLFSAKRLTLMCLEKPHKQGGLISKLLGLSLWLHQMNTNAQMYFRSHRFRNVQVEVLYQRYFLRMNQNNMVSLLGLLICISLVLIVTNHLMYSSNHSSLLQVSNMLYSMRYDMFPNPWSFSTGSHLRCIHSDVPATCHFDDQMLS